MGPLKLNKPRIHEELTSLVDSPNAHGPVRRRSHQQLHLVDVDHVQDRASVPDDGLEALVRVVLFRLPKFHGAVCGRRNQHVQALDFGVDQLAHHALVRLGRAQLRGFKVFLVFDVHQQLGVLVLLFVIENFAVRETHKEELLIGLVKIGAEVNLHIVNLVAHLPHRASSMTLKFWVSKHQHV